STVTPPRSPVSPCAWLPSWEWPSNRRATAIRVPSNSCASAADSPTPVASSPSAIRVDEVMTMKARPTLGFIVLAVVVTAPLPVVLRAGAVGSETQAMAGYHGFAHPQAVTIQGYTGTAMEPFISSDGQYLL